MKYAAWLMVVLLLSGCSVSQVLPSLPQLEPLFSQRQAPRIATQSVSIAQMEAQVQQRINAIRQQHGLTPLRTNEKLARVARSYSKRMAEQRFFSHTSPSGDTMVDRVRSAGVFYFMVGENLFMCTNIAQPVPASIEGWMNSPGHRANILRSEYRETGIGIWRQGSTYYFTQLFMRSVS